MAAPAVPNPPGPTPPPSLAVAVPYLARAVGRLETLLVLGLGVTLLTLVLDMARALGHAPAAVQAYGVTWTVPITSVVADAATAAIILLVLVGAYYALSGLIAWRRGVGSLRRAQREAQGDRAVHLAASVREDRRTLVTFLAAVLGAVLVGIAIGISDLALYAGGYSAIPAAAASLVVGLVAGALFVLVYYHGTRHLLEALAAVDPRLVSDSLRTGQELILVGAALGCLGSISAVLWPAEVVSVAGLALVLLGVLRIKSTYDAIAGPSLGGPGGSSAASVARA